MIGAKDNHAVPLYVVGLVHAAKQRVVTVSRIQTLEPSGKGVGVGDDVYAVGGIIPNTGIRLVDRETNSLAKFALHRKNRIEQGGVVVES